MSPLFSLRPNCLRSVSKMTPFLSASRQRSSPLPASMNLAKQRPPKRRSRQGGEGDESSSFDAGGGPFGTVSGQWSRLEGVSALLDTH